VSNICAFDLLVEHSERLELVDCCSLRRRLRHVRHDIECAFDSLCEHETLLLCDDCWALEKCDNTHVHLADSLEYFLVPEPNIHELVTKPEDVFINKLIKILHPVRKPTQICALKCSKRRVLSAIDGLAVD